MLLLGDRYFRNFTVIGKSGRTNQIHGFPVEHPGWLLILLEIDAIKFLSELCTLVTRLKEKYFAVLLTFESGIPLKPIIS